MLKNQDRIIILYETKDVEQLTKDALEKKRDIDFKPKYVLAPRAKTTRQRPQEFAGGFEEWIYNIKESNKKDEDERRLREKQKEQRAFVISVEFGGRIMNKFMKVN